MIKDLIFVANSLDKKGFKKEADYIDTIIAKTAERWDDDWDEPSDKDLREIEKEQEEFAEEEEAISPEAILSSSIKYIENEERPKEERDAFKRMMINAMLGGFGLGGKMELGGPGIASAGPIVAEAKSKKKPTKKQLDALDKNKNGKIDKEDFEILRNKKENKAHDSNKKKKCKNCGHMNHHDAKKCENCGHTEFEM